MTAQDKLNKAAQSHGWANWSEVLLHNAPPHVINLIVEEAMREADLSEALEIIDDYLNAGHKEARAAASEKAKAFYKKHTGKDYANRIDRESKPDLTWRPGAKVRITGNSNDHKFDIGEVVAVAEPLKKTDKYWVCWHLDRRDYWIVHESDAVVVG